MTYLFIAYTFVWLGVLGYVFILAQESRRLRARLEALESAQPSPASPVGRPRTASGYSRKGL